MKKALTFIFILVAVTGYSQSKKRTIYQEKLFQFSIAPGVGSNGVHPAGYINYFSFNLTSGYSAANHLIEIGGISNLNKEYTRGLQFAGLVNLTGGNAFATMTERDISKLKKKGFEANLHGGQFSGLVNIVVTNVFGLQASGGVNVSKNALFGIQLAGVSNTVVNYSFGLQVAGLYNSSVRAMDGVQLASLFNFTNGQLQGLQAALYNRSGRIEGKNSYGYSGATGAQIGLINSARKMNGFQVGLINFGGQMQGTQIGLINFYRGGTMVGTRDGTSIGLINIGHTVDLQMYADELFFTNYAILTGTGKNFRILDANKSVYIQNGIIFGYNPDLLMKDNTRWALGYGLYRMVYNRSATPGMNEFRFISTGAEVLHYNEGQDLNGHPNLLSRLKVSYGSRLHPKLSSIYLFGGLTYNLLISKNDLQVSHNFLKETVENGSRIFQHWPGVHFGVMLH